jgi:hypothetical protein
MANWQILLSAVSLSVTMLLWPQVGSGVANSCAELMKDIYKRVDALDLLDYSMNESAKASVNRKAHEYISDTLPAFKVTCPGEAKSIKDLENGNYLKKLAAKRERNRKAERHIKSDTKFDARLEDLLEVQR